MKYLTACIKESLRLYGSVPGIGRVTSELVEIEGHVIPPGTEISLILMVLHRDTGGIMAEFSRTTRTTFFSSSSSHDNFLNYDFF